MVRAISGCRRMVPVAVHGASINTPSIVFEWRVGRGVGGDDGGGQVKALQVLPQHRRAFSWIGRPRVTVAPLAASWAVLPPGAAQRSRIRRVFLGIHRCQQNLRR